MHSHGLHEERPWERTSVASFGQADLRGKGGYGRMTQFMGTYQNRLDAKGRVSIPAPFRNLLKNDDGVVEVVQRPSHKHPCIEGWPSAMFDALSAPLKTFDMFSDEQDDLAITLFADSFPVEPDKEGRIVLLESLRKHAGLADGVTFMGRDGFFEIWEPAAAERRRAEARARVRERGLTLPASAP